MADVQAGRTSERRHDLDALRAFAMLLGIALHGAIPYAPGFPWTIQDSRTSEVFLLLFMIIHGFRMPLFFLISGYFTMMMWRQRGLGALLRQRALRILVPCLLGLVTILPLSHWLGRIATASSDGANQAAPANAAAQSGNKSAAVPAATVAAAVRAGDLSLLQSLLT
ncbi:MAG: acyltransferase family protein, partial [Planctomycetaceae bacterium]